MTGTVRSSQQLNYPQVANTVQDHSCGRPVDKGAANFRERETLEHVGSKSIWLTAYPKGVIITAWTQKTLPVKSAQTAIISYMNCELLAATT
jgi:hypothetical protein